MEAYRQRGKNKCVVPGCKDAESKRHRFPKNNPDLFQKWITAVKNPVFGTKTCEQIHASYFVCSRHFCATFCVAGTKRGLTRNAYPTLYLPGECVESEVHSTTTQEKPDSPMLPVKKLKLSSDERSTIIAHMEAIQSKVNVPTPHTSKGFGATEYEPFVESKDKLVATVTPSTEGMSISAMECEPTTSAYVSDHPDYPCSPVCTPKTSIGIPTTPHRRPSRGNSTYRILSSVDVTSQADLTPKARKLYKGVIKWSRKTSSLMNRVKMYKKLLQFAEKFAETINLNSVFDKVNKTTYNFILSQIRMQKQHPKARRFLMDDKIFALSLMKSTGKGYRLLSKVFALPSRKTLTNLLSNVALKPGINDALFENMAPSVSKMTSRERCCIVMFDEMSVSPELRYNRKDDLIEGLGDSGSSRSRSIADHVNVFMVQGVFRKWKQPICFTFSDGPIKSQLLKSLIKQVIIKLQKIGLHVVATVCDQNSTNVSTINSLLKDTNDSFVRRGEENRLFGFLINNIEIVPLYDKPHLFKGIRNNLLEKDLQFSLNGKKYTAKWDHIKAFYYLDSEEDVRMCPKLNDQHILKESMNKMKVSLCTQVFSYNVGSLMKKISKWEISGCQRLEPEAAETAELILFLDQLFDSVNSNQKRASSSKPIKGGVTRNSEHHVFWRNCIETVKTMKFFSTKSKKFVSVPSVRNLVFTLRGFIYLTDKLLTEHKFNFVLTRFFQQDAIENLFGYIRSHGVRNTSPGSSQFIASFKTLLINNFMTAHSPHSNCEEDICDGVLANLKQFLKVEQSYPGEQKSPTIESTEPEIPADVHLNRKSKINKCAMVYYAGYIAKK